MVFSYEFYKISKNTFFTEHVRATTSFFWDSFSSKEVERNQFLIFECLICLIVETFVCLENRFFRLLRFFLHTLLTSSNEIHQFIVVSLIAL